MLNKNLRGLPDGALTPSVILSHVDGEKHHVGRVRVYWPFVVFRLREYPNYNITHAPTGCVVSGAETIKRAFAFIQSLREVADWEFTSQKGTKALAARKASVHLIPRLQRIS